MKWEANGDEHAWEIEHMVVKRLQEGITRNFFRTWTIGNLKCVWIGRRSTHSEIVEFDKAGTVGSRRKVIPVPLLGS